MTQPKTASKFTPGPWEVRVAGPASDEIEDMNLYKLETPLTGKIIGEIIDQQEANARLIAKAPEMYELLGKLLEGNGVCVHNQNPTEFPHTCYEPLICEEARRIKAEIDGIE